MLGYTLPKNSSALICTSDFKHKALIVDKSNGTILNCGTSSHFTPERSKLLNYQKINPKPIHSADGHTFSATGKGDLKLELPNGNQKPTPVTLKNVYYSPHLAFTLMSVWTIDRNGYDLRIKEGKCVIWSPKSNVIRQIPLIHDLYCVTTPSNPHKLAVASATVKKMSISELHRGMGHVNHNDLHKMVCDGMVTGIKLDFDSKPEFCKACIKAKAFRKSFPKKSKTTYCNYGDKVVADMWGPAPVESLGHKKYFQLYQDLSSYEEHVYFSCEKSEGFDNYKKYEAWVWVQRNAVIKIFGSNRGGEFRSKVFDKHLEYAETVHHLMVHDSPASNGAAEWANRTHIECTHAMISASGLPCNLWAEAVLHSIWIQNHIPTCSLDENKTPHEKGTRRKPDLLYLYEWGSMVWVKKLNTGKLDEKAEKGHFVGFNEESKDYRVYWPTKKKVFIKRNVFFNKEESLQHNDTKIEGEWDIPINLDTIEVDNESNTTPKDDKLTSDNLNTSFNNNEPNNTENVPETPDNNDSEPTIVQNDPPHPSVHRPWRKSLQELPQFDSTEFGHGKQNENTRTLHEGALAADNYHSAFILEENGSLEPGRVEININEAEWFQEKVGQAMAAISEDKPLLKEAMNGHERAEWIEAIEAKLTQIERLHTWDLVDVEQACSNDSKP
jgi:GAG-pre-integrase domain